MADNEILKDFTGGLARYLSEQTTVIMFALNIDGSIVWANEAFKRMLGRHMPMEGLDIRDLLAPESIAILGEAGGRIIDGTKLIFSTDKQSSHIITCKVILNDHNMLILSEHIMATETEVMKHMTAMNNELSNLSRELHRKNLSLQQAMAEIKFLKGLLPICMHCKKIRDDKGYWNNIEAYITFRCIVQSRNL